MGTTGVGLAKEEKESGRSRKWRYAAYAWTAIKNVMTFWLIYLAFEKVSPFLRTRSAERQSTFETLVIAGLVLIWLGIGDALTIYMRTSAEEAHVHRSLFLGLYKKFNDPEVKESEEL